MPHLTIEACCGSADDVVQAEKGGADRAELNSSLSLGGLTPSVGELTIAKAHTHIPILTMLRPRSGGFCYTQLEYETMLSDACALLEAGADGLVFGCLSPNGDIDAGRLFHLLEIGKGKELVFHRAFDMIPDWKRGLDLLINVGVTRVLTSGGVPSVSQAMDRIAEMIEFASGEIQILPGGGIKQHNVRQIVEGTGTTQIHLTHHLDMFDPSMLNNHKIRFNAQQVPPEDHYRQIDADAFAAIRAMYP